MSTARLGALRALAQDVRASLAGHDLLLYAAGLTFYAAVALVPLLLVALWLASVLLGAASVRHLGVTLAGLTPANQGLRDALRSVTASGTRLSVGAVVAAVLIASLYGEGFVRAFDRLSRHGERRGRGLRGRLLSLLLMAGATLGVVAGLTAASALTHALGHGTGSLVVGVYLAFLAGWLASTLLLLLVFTAFSPERLRLSSRLWGAAGAGSWVSGQSLGFVLVLGLHIDLGKAFGGFRPVATAVTLAFWLYLSHVVVLAGYVATLLVDARGGHPLGRRLRRGAVRQMLLPEPAPEPDPEPAPEPEGVDPAQARLDVRG